MTDIADDPRRAQVIAEYFKVLDILQSYDPYFLTIKTWGVTVSGAAIAIGISLRSSSVFFLVSLLAVGFWTTEVQFKLLQLGHMQRGLELEGFLSEPQTSESTFQPARVLGAFGERRTLNMRSRRWRSVFFWPQVMFPHVAFVAVGILSSFVLYFLHRK